MRTEDDVADVGPAHTLKFWTSFTRLGLLVISGEALAVLGYCLATFHRPHRVAIVVVLGVVAVAIAASFIYVERLTASRWRVRFSFVWILAVGVILTVLAILDGNVDSPLIYLFVFPIASAAMALPVRQVVISGGATLIELALIWARDPNPGRFVSDVTLFACTLVGLVVYAIGTAEMRDRLEKEEKRLQNELSTLATVDALTGCLNHGAFYERLEAEIARATRHHDDLSVLMIDVDQFKALNDTFGHVAGDDALATLGTSLRRVSRSFDITGRVGGDEFAVVLPATSLEDATGIAQRVTAALRCDTEPRLAVSVGVAELDAAHPTSLQIVREADASLYRAKAAGRAHVASEQPPSQE